MDRYGEHRWILQMAVGLAILAAGLPVRAGDPGTPAGTETELAELRAQMATLETTLAQEKQLREKNSADFIATWKLLKASREELQQLRDQAGAGQPASAVQDLQTQLAEKSAALAESERQQAAVRAEQDNLRQQLVNLSRVEKNPELEARLKQAQDDINRLAKALAEEQNQNKVLLQARELMVQQQIQEQLTRTAAAESLKNQVRQLEQEKTQSATRAADLEKRLAQATNRVQELDGKLVSARAAEAVSAQGVKDLAALKESLAAKERALAEAQ